MRKWIAQIKPDEGMVIHAGLGLMVGLAAWWAGNDTGVLMVCAGCSAFGFGRELKQAGSFRRFNIHKFFEGLAWSTCWLALLI